MPTKSILSSIAIVIAIGGLLTWGGRQWDKHQAQSAAVADNIPVVEGNQVVMTYFTTSVRCESCKKIEALTRETADKDFAAAVAAKRLIVRVIDTDQPADKHYIKTYNITDKTVIISHRVNGKETGFSNMPKVWDLLEQPADFHAYLGNQIRTYLDS